VSKRVPVLAETHSEPLRLLHSRIPDVHELLSLDEMQKAEPFAPLPDDPVEVVFFVAGVGAVVSRYCLVGTWLLPLVLDRVEQALADPHAARHLARHGIFEIEDLENYWRVPGRVLRRMLDEFRTFGPDGYRARSEAGLQPWLTEYVESL
jgi:hypothetical protein